MVKSPEEPMGSPSSTASCAPGGRAGGTGPNLIWSGLNAFWDNAGSATPAVMTSKRTTNIRFIGALPSAHIIDAQKPFRQGCAPRAIGRNKFSGARTCLATFAALLCDLCGKGFDLASVVQKDLCPQ